MTANGVPCELLRGPSRGSATILYLHGGGFGAGSCRSHAHFAARLAESAGCEALTVDYRRAPEAVFPAALCDAVAAYKWLLGARDPRSIVLAGDSAGGGIALSTLLTARDGGLPLPSCLFMLSPWADLSLSGSSHRALAHLDPLVTTQGLARMADAYAGGASLHDPMISPSLADLSGLPPLLLQVGSAEVLLSDSLAVAQKAALGGTEVRLEVWADMVHVWPLFHAQLDAGRRALVSAGEWIATQIAPVGPVMDLPRIAGIKAG